MNSTSSLANDQAAAGPGLRGPRSGPRRTRAVAAILLGLMGCREPLPVPVPEAEAHYVRGQIFGTRWSAVWTEPHLVEAEVRSAFQEVFEDVDLATSGWRDDSEVAGFQAAAAGEPRPIGATLEAVLGIALEVARASGGAFDPTVGPLVRLWGFGPEGAQQLPSDAEVEATLAGVGWDELTLGPGTLTPRRTGLELDLSGVAKGLAVDGMAARLQVLGSTNFLVEIGGEFVAGGVRPGGGPWRLGIERPALRPDSTPELWRAIEVSDQALATSGNYRNVRGEGNERYGHTIDPRTGRPVDNDVFSVTVLADSCALADALATAFLVLGPGEAESILGGYPGVQAIFLLAAEGGPREITLP